MAYYSMEEFESRLGRVREIIEHKKLDCALIYYDEFNLANAWYLTGWCPQFESGAVLVPVKGEPMILGGPESEPFAKMDSAIKVDPQPARLHGSRRGIPECGHHQLRGALQGVERHAFAETSGYRRRRPDADVRVPPGRGELPRRGDGGHH